jgi:acyl-CoA thioester hydrolase
MTAPAKPFSWQSRIRFVDTDSSQRIHYTAMFRHFEAAEQEFLHALGTGYSQAGGEHVGFPRVHVECDFQAEIRYDEIVSIEVQVERVGNSSFTFLFFTTVEQRPVAKGRIVIVCMDKQTKRPCPIPDRLAQALRDYMNG